MHGTKGTQRTEVGYTNERLFTQDLPKPSYTGGFVIKDIIPNTRNKLGFCDYNYITG